MDYPAYPCPKCKRPLECSGVLTVDLDDGEHEVPSYQCDECLMKVDIGGGETMEVALTFAVGADGSPFDPADPDGQLRF